VWLLTRGNITHNLSWFRRNPQPKQAREMAQSRAFRQWWQQRSQAGDGPALCAHRTLARHAQDMHPSNEHPLPHFAAAGWGVARRRLAQGVHEGAPHGVIGIDTYPC
jgi:4,5-DOPA dioxygenase extradiol